MTTTTTSASTPTPRAPRARRPRPARKDRRHGRDRRATSKASRAARTGKTGTRTAAKPKGQPIVVMGHTLSDIGRQMEPPKSGGYLARCYRGVRVPSLPTLRSLQRFLSLATLDETARIFAPGV